MSFSSSFSTVWAGDTQLLGVDALLSFARLASGAEGYALAELEDSGDLTVRHAGGVPVRISSRLRATGRVVVENGAASITYPLGENALVIFAFQGAVIHRSKIQFLNRLASAIELLYAIPRTTARRAARIGALDAELAGVKITERVRGLIGKGPVDQAAVDAVVRQVEQVVGTRQAEVAFSRLLEFLEDRLEERKMMVAAKELLEQTHGLSEEAAYLFLRDKSRASRQRIRAVAQELLESSAEG